MGARTSRYHEVYRRSLADPEGFWREAAADIDWIKSPERIFDPNAGVYGRWFPFDARLQHLLQRDRSPRRARPRRPGGDHLRLAGRRHQAHDQLRHAPGSTETQILAGDRCATSASARAIA